MLLCRYGYEPKERSVVQTRVACVGRRAERATPTCGRERSSAKYSLFLISHYPRSLTIFSIEPLTLTL